MSIFYYNYIGTAHNTEIRERLQQQNAYDVNGYPQVQALRRRNILSCLHAGRLDYERVSARWIPKSV